MFYIINTEGLNLFGNQPIFVSNKNENYAQALVLLRDSKFDELIELVSPKNKIIKAGLSVEGNKVLWDEREIDETLANRILSCIQLDLPIEPLKKFLDKCAKNPNPDAINRLYTFLDRSKLPINEDGNFLAFKRVNRDFSSVHDKSVSNVPGTVVKMDRKLCDENSNVSCSTGLHFCSEEYLKSFSGEVVVALEVNPTNVTAIPYDYQDSKGRCCEYKVLYALDEEMKVKAINKQLEHQPVKASVKPTPKLIRAYNNVIVDKVMRARRQKKKATHYLTTTEMLDTVSIGYAMSLKK